jgi:hypothetical protein
MDSVKAVEVVVAQATSWPDVVLYLGSGVLFVVLIYFVLRHA